MSSSLCHAARINFKTPTSSPLRLRTDYGLFTKCDSSSWSGDSHEVTCKPWPIPDQCKIVRDDDPPNRKVVDTEEARQRLGDKDGLQWGFCQSWITAQCVHVLRFAFLWESRSNRNMLAI
jgi:hypothetical protein